MRGGCKASFDKNAFLNMLARSRTSKRRKLLAQWASKKEFLAVSKCVRNILKGNVKFNPHQLKTLRQHNKSLRILAKKTGALSEKRRVIAQSGGFFMSPFLSVGSVLKAARKATSIPVLSTAAKMVNLVRSA